MLKLTGPCTECLKLTLGRNFWINFWNEGHRKSYLQLIAASNHFWTGFGAGLIIESTQITNQSTFLLSILHHHTFYRGSCTKKWGSFIKQYLCCRPLPPMVKDHTFPVFLCTPKQYFLPNDSENLVPSYIIFLWLQLCPSIVMLSLISADHYPLKFN